MNQNSVCRLLDISHPVLQGGMLWIASAELASAVSNTGGLGIISPMAAMAEQGNPVENLKNQIAATRRLTSKPFGVNIPLDLSIAGNLISTVMDEPVGIVITAAGDPFIFTGLLKSGGIRVLHVVGNVSQAVRAESAGVDAVIVEGIEAAGHNGVDELPLFSLIPQVSDAVGIPVIAAGGIVDGRGMAAAFCLGAKGIQMGTRFVAVKENIAHGNYKQAICQSKDTGTVVTCRKLIPTRSLKAPFTATLLKMEQRNCSQSELLTYLGYRSNRTAQIQGDLTRGEAYCGTSAGLIKQVVSVKEVMTQLTRDFHNLLSYLQNMQSI